MMIKPSIDQLTHGGQINRYELVIATSKVARAITDEYCEQREEAETMIRDGKTEEPCFPYKRQYPRQKSR